MSSVEPPLPPTGAADNLFAREATYRETARHALGFGGRGGSTELTVEVLPPYSACPNPVVSALSAEGGWRR